ncbi:MAG: lipase family protein [Clostridiales bacterium]|nr:lipase family protein [Clostridiales bacterium]
MTRRIIAFIIALCLAAALLPSGALAWDENVILSLGVREVSHKDMTNVTDSFDWTFKWTDEYFQVDSHEYSPELAMVSIGLALGARIKTEAESVLSNLGFEDCYFYGYDLPTSKDSIAYAIGRRELSDGTQLVAVGIRGSGYGDEWAGNFEIGETITTPDGYIVHKNFYNSAVKVLQGLNKYLEDRNIDSSRSKVWIAGNSRSAAVANVAAHLISEKSVMYEGNSLPLLMLGFSESSIYAYTFGIPAPMAVKSYMSQSYKTLVSDIFGFISADSLFSAASREIIDSYFRQRLGGSYLGYSICETNGKTYALPRCAIGFKTEDESIFNHLNYRDIVTKVMPKDWGFTVFGKSVLMRLGEGNDYRNKILDEKNVAEQLSQIFAVSNRTGEEWAYVSGDNRAKAAEGFVRILATLTEDPDTYTRIYQDDFMGLILASGIGKEETDTELVLKHVENILGNVLANPLNLVKLLFKPVLGNINTPTEIMAVTELIEKANSGNLDTEGIVLDDLMTDPENKLKAALSELIDKNCSEYYGALKLNKPALVNAFMQTIYDLIGVPNLEYVNYDMALEHYLEFYLAWLTVYAGLEPAEEENQGRGQVKPVPKPAEPHDKEEKPKEEIIEKEIAEEEKRNNFSPILFEEKETELTGSLLSALNAASLRFTIRAAAGEGGKITPAGDKSVVRGGKMTYAIVPDEGKKVEDVKVDGVSLGAIYTYTFKNVQGNHTIEVVFG